MNKVVAVVTTYNRLQLLKENMEALLTQSFKECDLLIINNASTDGTEEYVQSITDKRVLYYNTGANIGGAGGFAFGLRKAIEAGYDYAWLMDDDSIVEKNALQNLMNSAFYLQDKFSFMASTVYWTDGTQFPMNTTRPEEGFHFSIKEVREHGLIQIKMCSFVGCFVNLKIAEKVGLPYAEYFIYGDDEEYTTRLRKEEKAYWVINSDIIHKAPSKAGSNIVRAPFERIDRFSIQARNGAHIERLKGDMFGYYKRMMRRIVQIFRHSPDHKWKRVCVLVKGLYQGLTFNPQIQYAKRLNTNGKEE